MATKKKKTKTTKPSTKKKVPAKKIKVPSKKKKAVKTVPNPHEGKRYFMLDFGGYGGEFIVATTTDEFVEYWLDEENKHGLADHVMAMHEKALDGDDFDEDAEDDNEEDDEGESGYDNNSPEVKPGVKYREYWDLGDIEHDTVLSREYASFTVQEIVLHPKAVYTDGTIDWDDKECKKRNFDWSQNKYTEKGEATDYNTEGLQQVYSQEMFIDNDESKVENPVPVLMIYDSQKGSFYRLYIETNGEDFDVSKLIIGINENNMTEYVTEYFYDKVSLSKDHDWLSTWGKGFHADVGYMSQYDIDFNREEWLKEGWKELEEE